MGAIVASGTNRGCMDLVGRKSWIIPLWLQALFPGIVVVFSMLLPESPRWLYCNGKQDQAKAFLTKYHGHGNPDSEWVKLQLFEYESHLELDGADKRWWDYRALFKNRASRYRLATNCLTALFGQWAGNGVVSYFLAGVLQQAGVDNATTRANLFVAMNAVQVVISSLGACFVDRIGRRPLLIWVNVGCSICWIGVIAASGVHDKDKTNKASSAAVVAMIYIFQAVYSFGWTPLQALYPVEVLSYEMRAKGMAFSGLFVNFGTLVNQFGFPESLEKIQWKTYIVFMIWCLVQAGLAYLFAPETKNRTVSFHCSKFAQFNANHCNSSKNLMTSSALQTQEKLPLKRRSSSSMPTPMLSVFRSLRTTSPLTHKRCNFATFIERMCLVLQFCGELIQDSHCRI